MGAFNLASVLTVWRAVGRPERRPLLVILVLALLVGGAQIQFLMASLWQEATLWAAALAAAFVYLVVSGYYSQRGFTAGLLAVARRGGRVVPAHPRVDGAWALRRARPS